MFYRVLPSFTELLRARPPTARMNLGRALFFWSSNLGLPSFSWTQSAAAYRVLPSFTEFSFSFFGSLRAASSAHSERVRPHFT